MTDDGVRVRSKAKPGSRRVWRLATGATLLCAAVAGMAQVPAAPASAADASNGEKHPKFEVISIKRHASEGGPVQNGRPGPTPDGFRSIGLPMVGIFQWAYALPNQPGLLRGDRIEGDPRWLEDELYDVVAKVHQADLADWQKPAMRQSMLRKMLQAMLAERCKVVVHYGIKESSVYNLVVTKGGPKFKPAETVDMAELRRKHPQGRVMMGSGTMALPGPNGTQFYAISMAILANTILPSVADRPVVDKTGLTGYYDLALPSSALRRSPPPPAPSQPLDAPSSPLEDESIFTALETLGLRLVPAKGQVETLAIDHVERPSEN
jgi:bla regulator protein blaR1